MSLAKSIRRPAPEPRAQVRKARPPTVEALEPRLAPDAARAVGQLYRDLLQRTPDPSGLAHWSAALDSGLTRAQVALQITSSPEYQGNQVQALYQRFLHREADPEGLRHHMNALAQGASVGQVAAVMAASAEYRARFASTDSAFVQALIADALGRTASDGEVSTLVGGKDRLGIAVAVLSSPEAHLRQVRDAYTRLLQRDADPSGLDHWSGALDRGLLTEEAVAALLVGSAESADLVRDGGLIAPLGGDGIVPQTAGFTTPLLFQGINPIRVVDTRFPASTGVYGSPALVGGATRDFDLIPNVAPNDLPAGVKALVLTVTMVAASGAVNYVTIWPAGLTMPPTASLVTDHDGALTSSEVISAVGTHGAISVFAYGATDLVVDITGYFLDDLRAGDRLALTGTYDSGGLVGASNASTAIRASALVGTISSTAPGLYSVGVRGINNGTGSSGIGVSGEQAGTGLGVFGVVAGAGYGVYGQAGGGGTGVSGNAGGPGSEGVYGYGETGVYGAGSLYGVYASGGASGIYVHDGDTLGDAVYVTGGTNSVFAITSSSGQGVYATASGTNGWGVLGAGGSRGVYGIGTLYGVYSSGDLGASGTKYFVDPHPTDPTKEVRYISLEGPEAGIYYRGNGHFVNGLATVSFPDYFTFEAEPEGLSVTITPIGALAMTAVQTLDTSHAVLLSSADVNFTYTVNGIRAGYADFNPIHDNIDFVPRAVTWAVLNAVQKQRLITTGLYHEDGTPNMETIRALGWDTPERMGVPSATPANVTPSAPPSAPGA